MKWTGWSQSRKPDTCRFVVRPSKVAHRIDGAGVEYPQPDAEPTVPFSLLVTIKDIYRRRGQAGNTSWKASGCPVISFTPDLNLEQVIFGRLYLIITVEPFAIRFAAAMPGTVRCRSIITERPPMSAQTLPDNLNYWFSPSYDLEDDVQQARIIVEGMMQNGGRQGERSPGTVAVKVHEAGPGAPD